MQEIIVSIICITYNHEKYISDAIESFLSQKTNFKFEIIIHDDASIDNTTQIIMGYEKRYPDIIHTIVQKKNQFSQGKVIADSLLERETKGKYIIVCEGDDYWTDENKLQKQVEYLEKNSQCAYCFHNAKTIYMDTKEVDETWVFIKGTFKGGDRKYSLDEMIQMRCVPNASILMRREHLPIPQLYSSKVKLGDMIHTIYLATKGEFVYCMKDTMSVYRRQGENSMSADWVKSIEHMNRKTESVIETYQNIDRYTNYKYHSKIEESIEVYRRRIIILNEDKIKKFCSSVEYIYIYGIGNLAKFCSEKIKELGVNILGYIVSDGEKKSKEFLGKKVYYFSDFEKESGSGIMIAVGNQNSKEIVNKLESREIRNFCIATKE